ncbi:MAG: tetratricopeptide repeat protein [Mariniblastus sp.]
MGIRIGIGIAILSVVICAGYFLADYYRESPKEVVSTYVGRDSCVDCHQTQVSLFHGSDHDLAMDIATDDSVLANFDGQTIEHHGITSTVFRNAEKFMVNTEGPDGEMQDFEVKYVFGVRPLQQYMVELERPADAKENEIGRVQVLRISWDTTKKKWFYLDPPDVNEKLDPDDPLHWTGITQNWNASCATCHSTNLQKNFDPQFNEYHTTFSEIDVSCEACHGPGSFHVELANRKSMFWDREHGFGLVKLKTESNLPQIESCAPCHSRRTVIDDKFKPGCNFDDYFATQLVADPIYHADGQIRDEDYVYGSFIQSKMYHNGIRCTDCHDPHSTKVKFNDNQLCTSCHQHEAGKYDTINHHHHEPGKPGSFCVDCHMPATTYMMVDSRRDHSLRVPRPDLSVQLGTPNACSGCHVDSSKLAVRPDGKPLTQYLDWVIAAENGDEIVKSELERINTAMLTATEKWYPADQSAEKSKYYEQLAVGLSRSDQSTETLMEMATDITVPALFRASALSELGSDASKESFDVALESLDDSDAKVIAAALLRLDTEISRIGGRQQYSTTPRSARDELRPIGEAIAKLFDHPSKRVRIEAARVFVSLDTDSRATFSSPEQRSNFQKALDELKRSLNVENDRAAYHMMLGGLHEMLGDTERAKDSYRFAITVEPTLAGARSNLAALLEADVQRKQQEMRQSQQSGGIAAGQLKGMLEQMQRTSQKSAKLRYDEHAILAKDIERSKGLADTHGLHYRFAMSSYIQRDLRSAETHLLEAHRQQPGNPRYLMGLAAFYLEVRDGAEALNYINPLIKLDPQHPGYQALLNSARSIQEQNAAENTQAPKEEQ